MISLNRWQHSFLSTQRHRRSGHCINILSTFRILAVRKVASMMGICPSGCLALYKKLIRRWDSERELSVRRVRRHRARTTKYNRLVHSATDRCGGYVWNACLPNSV